MGQSDKRCTEGECVGAIGKGSPVLPGTVIAIFDSNGVNVGTKKHSHKGGIAHTALWKSLEVTIFRCKGKEPQLLPSNGDKGLQFMVSI